MEIETLDLMMGIFAIFTPVFSAILLFIMKQMADVKKAIANLCERMAREETKSEIYHDNDLRDK